MHKILLKGRFIEHSYSEGSIKTPVLKGVNLDIEASKMTAIVGKSGSGKSTLLHILGTLDTPDKGEIYFQNTYILTLSPKEKAIFRNRHLGFVYQFHHLLGDFSALENIMMPLLIDKVSTSLAQNRANNLLERVGLKDLAHKLPSEMSGGERQRVAIARALAYSPELILADEPTGNLDEYNANMVFDLFRELVQDEGSAVVMVTHDNALASRCDNIYSMTNGIIENGTFAESLSEEFAGSSINLKPEAKGISHDKMIRPQAKSINAASQLHESYQKESDNFATVTFCAQEVTKNASNQDHVELYSYTVGSYRINKEESNRVGSQYLDATLAEVSRSHKVYANHEAHDPHKPNEARDGHDSLEGHDGHNSLEGHNGSEALGQSNGQAQDLNLAKDSKGNLELPADYSGTSECKVVFFDNKK